MAIVKAGFFLVAALGSTFAVREVTTTYLGPRYFADPAGTGQAAAPGGGAQQATGQAAPASGGSAQPAPGGSPGITDLSQQEIDAELKRAQEAITTGQPPKPGKSGELEEYLPVKPLPADLAVGLPSDI